MLQLIVLCSHDIMSHAVLCRYDPQLQQLIAARKKAWYDQRPQLAGSGVYERQLLSRLGVPLDFDALNTSMVYAPGDVEERCAACGCQDM